MRSIFKDVDEIILVCFNELSNDVDSLSKQKKSSQMSIRVLSSMPKNRSIMKNKIEKCINSVNDIFLTFLILITKECSYYEKRYKKNS